MPTTINHVTFDALDPYAQARWWCALFEVEMDDDDHPGDPAAIVHLPGGTGILFEQVPDGKVVKNRVHLDLTPDVPRDEMVDRLLGRGAAHVADHRRPDGSGWVVLADPEGNELCVERSAAERAGRG